jgi:hypothetical protein
MKTRNLVDPWGRAKSSAGDGLWSGNRGKKPLLDNGGLPRSPLAWIYCVRHWPAEWPLDEREAVQFTWLIFLDEPTALAAGHRPCGVCQTAKLRRFAEAWYHSNPGSDQGAQQTVRPIDLRLRDERVADGQKVTYLLDADQLPSGAMFRADSTDYLKWGNCALAWSLGGYQSITSVGGLGPVHVLTPRSVVRMLPSIEGDLVLHPTALRLIGETGGN